MAMRLVLKFLVLTMSAAGLVLAQRGGGGGGHHGGSGGGSFGGGYAARPSVSGGFSSGRAVTPPASGYPARSYGYASGYGYPNRGGYNYSTGVNRTIGRPYGYGYGRRYGYYGLAYYPVFGYGDSWYDPSYYAPYDQYAPYQEYPQYGLTPDPNVEVVGNPYVQQAPYAMPARPVPMNDPPAPPAAPIVVVLKNGQHIQMQSYGIMNGLLWDFSRPNSQRIPMASIDVAASVRATQAVGGSFPEEFFAANPN
jgi:hypothetical protein